MTVVYRNWEIYQGTEETGRPVLDYLDKQRIVEAAVKLNRPNARATVAATHDFGVLEIFVLGSKELCQVGVKQTIEGELRLLAGRRVA